MERVKNRNITFYHPSFPSETTEQYTKIQKIMSAIQYPPRDVNPTSAVTSIPPTLLDMQKPILQTQPPKIANELSIFWDKWTDLKSLDLCAWLLFLTCFMDETLKDIILKQ